MMRASLAAAGARSAVDNLEQDAAEERRLVEGAARGEAAALEALYQRFHQRLFNLIVRMVGREDAEELAQESFVRIFRGVGRFRGEAALGTWAYRLTMNVCLTWLARRARRGRLHAQLAHDSATESEALVSAPSNPWLRERLEHALAELPDGYRAVLVLHDVEGLNHQEIAEILGCRVGTSKSQLHKARLRMRELLGPADEATA